MTLRLLSLYHGRPVIRVALQVVSFIMLHATDWLFKLQSEFQKEGAHAKLCIRLCLHTELDFAVLCCAVQQYTFFNLKREARTQMLQQHQPKIATLCLMDQTMN